MPRPARRNPYTVSRETLKKLLSHHRVSILDLMESTDLSDEEYEQLRRGDDRLTMDVMRKVLLSTITIVKGRENVA